MKDVWKIYIICGMMTIATCMAGVIKIASSSDVGKQKMSKENKVAEINIESESKQNQKKAVEVETEIQSRCETETTTEIQSECETDSLTEQELKVDAKQESIQINANAEIHGMIMTDRVYYAGLETGCEYSIRVMIVDANGEYMRYEDVCISDRVDFVAEAAEGYIDLQIILPEDMYIEDMYIQETLYSTHIYPEDGAISQLMLVEHMGAINTE